MADNEPKDLDTVVELVDFTKIQPEPMREAEYYNIPLKQGDLKYGEVVKYHVSAPANGVSKVTLSPSIPEFLATVDWRRDVDSRRNVNFKLLRDFLARWQKDIWSEDTACPNKPWVTIMPWSRAYARIPRGVIPLLLGIKPAEGINIPIPRLRGTWILSYGDREFYLVQFSALDGLVTIFKDITDRVLVRSKEPAKKKRGRPVGSKNKKIVIKSKKGTQKLALLEPPAPKKRGRPKKVVVETI